MHLIYVFLFSVLTQNNEGKGPEDDGQRELCSFTVPRARDLIFGLPIGEVVDTDENGCFYRKKTEQFFVCHGRELCTAMPYKVPSNITILKLTQTNIRTFQPGDFRKLRRLDDLQIEGNSKLERIANGTFRGLTHLTSLSLSYNSNLKVLEPNAFEDLLRLRELFLGKNGFTDLYDATYSVRPTVLPNLITLSLESNRFGEISERDFEALADAPLQVLCLTLCALYNISPLALVPLKNLQELFLGENSVEVNALTEMLTKMIENGIDLKALDLYSMGFKKSPPRALMQVIAKSNISRLNLSKNQFETIDSESFPYMPNLELLDLSEVKALDVVGDAFGSLPKLKCLVLSTNKLSQIPEGILGLENLRYLDMQNNSPPGESRHVYFSLRDVHFSNMSRLKYLDLGLNGLGHLFNTSFLGLGNLQELHLNNSFVYFIEPGTFSELKELRVLNLENNNMVHRDAVPDVFSELVNLHSLFLGGCNFRYVVSKNGQNPFRTLTNLKFLSLERNLLSTIYPEDFTPLKALRLLDVSYNAINSWDVRMFSHNSDLNRLVLAKNKISDIKEAMFDDFAAIGSVDLDHNAINCKCLVAMTYKQWYKKTENEIFQTKDVFTPKVNCGYPDAMDQVPFRDFLLKPHFTQEVCKFQKKRILLLVPLVCTSVFFTALCVLAFWYRWHIKYWLFLAKLYLSRKGRIRANNRHPRCYDNYEYDAFVSYSTEDREFVLKLITMVETCEPFLKLCVYERDFQIGTMISDSVLESVARSRKTLLVISNNYAKSQWCRWESQICEHHRLFFEDEHGEYVDDSLVLIKLSQVNDSYLTPTLKYLLKTRIYLEWMSDASKEAAFWSKLRDTLGPPIASIKV